MVQALLRDDREEAKALISSAYIVVGGIGIVLCLAGYVSMPLVNWSAVFHVSPNTVPLPILLRVIRILYIGFMAQFTLRLITSIFYALQHSAVPSLLTLISSLSMLVFASFSLVSTQSHRLEAMAIAQALSSNLPYLVASFIVFSTTLRSSRPSFQCYRRSYAIKVMKLGGVFFWLQLMTLLIFGTNEILISWFVNPSMVVEFQMYNRLLATVSSIFQLALTPVWSAVTEAYGRGDFKWVLKLHGYLSLMSVACTLLLLTVASFMQPVVDFWLRERSISIVSCTALICGLSCAINVWINVNSAVAAGIGELRTPAQFLTAGAFVNAPLAFVLSSVTHSWTAIVLANIVSMIPYGIVQPIRLRKLLRAQILSGGPVHGNHG